MFIRGTSSAIEQKRIDYSFYRGIVVKNNDPSKLNRVKVFIPELSNQPYDNWFEKFEKFILKSPGKNSNPKKEKEKDKTGDWEDLKLFEEICKSLPWAEPCYPVMGESGNFKYYKNGEISTISDCNYEEGYEIINQEFPTLEKGSFSPSFLYENETTALGDSFSEPLDNFCVKCNPYSFSYRPMKNVNKAKGIFGIPEVGSKVWLFHDMGDLNFPIYFGVHHDFREFTLLNDTDNEFGISSKYPSNFEN